MSRFVLMSLLAIVQNVYGQMDSFDCDKFGNYIETQADINAISHCRILSGSLGIDRDFQGFATISGVTSVRSFWAGNSGASHSSPTLSENLVQSISLPDLVSAGISISGTPYLYKLDLPKLKTVDGILEISRTALTSISLPSLETITGPASFSGIFDQLDLSNLKTARRISIETTGSLDCTNLWEQLKTITWTDEDTEYFPAFTCKSPKGQVKSPLTNVSGGGTTGSATSSSTRTAAQGSESTTTSTIPNATNKISEALSESSKTTTSPVHETISTKAWTSSVASTLVPVGNSTVSLKTTTTRLGTSTAVPESLKASAGNFLVTKLWGCIGSVAAISFSLLLL